MKAPAGGWKGRRERGGGGRPRRESETRGRKVRYVVQILSKVLDIVTLYGKYTRALTFENGVRRARAEAEKCAACYVPCEVVARRLWRGGGGRNRRAHRGG